MNNNNSLQRQILIKFSNDQDLNEFRNECSCYENYLEKSPHTLLGCFTEHQLNIAANKYYAIVSFELNYHTHNAILQNRQNRESSGKNLQ